MNKKIGLFLPYFGKLPNYFDLWIKSVAINPTITFILITDQKLHIKTPSNLQIINFSFKKVQSLVRSKFNTLDISLDNPYKLCDFRPAYGYIFYNLIKKFNLDYWGYCDPDVIWGKVDYFLKKYNFYQKNYDKVGYLGHFQFFSNDEIKLFSNIIDNEKFRNYKYVFTHPYSYHFDEEIGIGLIAKKLGVKTINFGNNPPYADILPNKLQFYTNPNAKFYEFPRYFYWDSKQGLFQYIYINKRFVKFNIMYVHIQKRNMEMNPNLINKSEFYIFPNRFISVKQKNNLNIISSMQDKFYLSYYINKWRTIVTKLSFSQIKHTKYFERLLEEYYSWYKNDL